MTEPTATEPRTAEQVTRELEQERSRLVAAVADVRTDVRDAVVRQVPRAAVAGAVVLGLLVVRALARRRGRHGNKPSEVYRIGRYALVDHDD
jgi:hypothetical protein